MEDEKAKKVIESALKARSTALEDYNRCKYVQGLVLLFSTVITAIIVSENRKGRLDCGNAVIAEIVTIVITSLFTLCSEMFKREYLLAAQQREKLIGNTLLDHPEVQAGDLLKDTVFARTKCFFPQ